LPFLLNQLRLLSQETSSILPSAGLGSSLYSIRADPTENTVFVVIAQQCLDCCLRIRCRGNLFTESLPSNERLLWLRYCGFQALCHIINSVFVCVVTACSSVRGRCFWAICRLCLEGRTMSQARNQLSSAFHLFLIISCLAYSSNLKMEAICSYEMSALSELHGVTTQNTALIVVTAVTTSTPNIDQFRGRILWQFSVMFRGSLNIHVLYVGNLTRCSNASSEDSTCASV
jgi:hypothetical protein